MEKDLNLKSFKPTLKPPSSMGKKIDTGFSNKMRNAGVNFKSIKEEENKDDSGKSLKKKIFSLPKMETLVAQDDYLHGIYEKMKVDASETYGYHWNETVHNILFNDYVLNDNAYLQKYKNTQTIFKKRRGEEGAQELEKAVQDKIDTSTSGDDKPEFNRKKVDDVPKDSIKDKAKDQLDMEKEPTNEVADQMKDMTAKLEMDELFGLGKKPSAPLTTHKASKNDTYYVDKNSNNAVGVISQNLSPEQNQQTATQFVDASKYEKMPWYVAVQNQVKGVPAQVSDGSVEDFAQDQQKYAGIPAMEEDCDCPETKPVRNPNDAMASFAKLGENMDNVGETTSAASAGQFAGPLDGAKNTGENPDHTYKTIDETTTSSSSGQFSGPAIWAKTSKNSRWAHTPAWHGGKILKEAKDYLTNPESFKKYFNLIESIEKINEIIGMDENSAKEDAMNILNRLNRELTNQPELAELPEFQELIAHYQQVTQSPQPQMVKSPAPVQKPEPNNQWREPVPAMKETSFDTYPIHQQKPAEKKPIVQKPEPVAQWKAPVAPMKEETSKKQKTMNEDPSYKGMLKTDLKDTGNKVSTTADEDKLETQDGLFKGKWSTNESLDPVNIAAVAAGIAGVVGTGVGIAGLMQLLKTKYPNAYNALSNVGSAAKGSIDQFHGIQEDGSINEDPVNIGVVAAGIASVVGTGVGIAGLMQLLKTKYPNAYNALSNIGGAAKGSVDRFNGIQENAVSKKQQEFMGMVHADQQGKLKNPSAAVDKVAHSISPKDAKDFASTKHKGLPDHVKEDNAAPAVSTVGTVNVSAGSQQGNPVMIEMGKLLYPFDAGLPDAEFATKAQQFIDGDVRTKGKNPQAILDAIRKKSKELGLTENGGNFQMSPSTDSDEENSFQSLVDNFRNGNLSDAKVILQQIKAAGQVRDLRLYLDSVGQDSQIKDWAFDNLSEESMIDDRPDSMARTMDSDELNTSGKPMGGSGGASVAENSEEETAVADFVDGPESNQGDRQDKEAIADAAKFRDFLRSKYGVESVAELSPRQKQEVWKEMQASKQQSAAPEMNFKNFAATDAQRAEFQGRDNKQLGFLAQHNNEVNSLQDYQALEKKYGQEMGERMFHPMAILAAIDALPDEEKAQYSNIERVLQSQMNENWHKKNVVNPKEKGKHTNVSLEDLHKQLASAKKSKNTSLEKELNFAIRAKTGWGKVNEKTKKEKSMNEERKTPSMLNLDQIKKETAALTAKDMANADALKQGKVYPNPDEFYIEQDKDKIQEFKTGEELEAEALKKIADNKKALENVGNSTNESGNEITKRNLTKEEKLKLAMDRGDGMHNIVYDNKPSDKFEKRLQKDMGEDQYKLRQEKMKYREQAPSYNKDTQPVETGEKKEQDDKFKKGFNEAFTGKYTDGYGKSKLVEFMLENTEEVSTINEGFKLTLEGLGNKYTQKINESEIFVDVVNQYDFYLVEDKVLRTKVAKDKATTVLENTMSRMDQLIKYSSGDFVNTKKSVKF